MSSFFVSSVTVGGGGSCSIFSGYHQGTASSQNLALGKETVQGPLKASHNVTLNGTIVEGDKSLRSGHAMTLNEVTAGDVQAGHGVNITSSKLGRVKSGHSCTITETTAGDVQAGHGVNITSSKLGRVKSGHSCAITETTAGDVQAGHEVIIKNCSDVSSIQAGHFVDMDNCKVTGDVKASKEAHVKNSTVGGTLSFTCGDSRSTQLENVVCPKVVITYRDNIEIGNIRTSGNFGIGKVTIGGMTQAEQRQITLPEEYSNCGISCISTVHYSFNHCGRTVSYSGDTDQIIIQGERLSDLIRKYGKAAEVTQVKEKPEVVLILEGTCKIQEVVFVNATGKIVCSDGNDFQGNIRFLE